jgi:hypothetical protein
MRKLNMSCAALGAFSILVSVLLWSVNASGANLGLGGAVPTTEAVKTPRKEKSVSHFRGEMEKWVETRQIISEERSDWEVEREILKATKELLQQQSKLLRSEISELTESSTVADEERRDLLLERGEYQRVNRTLEERIRAMEEEVLALAPRLPEPLQKKLEPLLVQIPDDPENTRQQLGQRLMNVLGVLSQAEKFNGTATFVGETRAVKGDQKVQIRTLYWGLGQAIYVDSRGEVAGIGRPGPDGWEFSSDPALADSARLLLDIYEGTVDVIEFVRLPVEIR